MQARVDTPTVVLYIDSIDYAITSSASVPLHKESNQCQRLNINYPQASQEYLGFQFTLTRSSTDVTKGPLFTGYQIKALPAIPRQRLIQYPLSCYVRVEDFRTGESYIGLIEELDFRNATPSDKRFTGYGGTLLVTIRTV
jgi:hypothetical protein